MNSERQKELISNFSQGVYTLDTGDYCRRKNPLLVDPAIINLSVLLRQNKDDTSKIDPKLILIAKNLGQLSDQEFKEDTTLKIKAIQFALNNEEYAPERKEYDPNPFKAFV